MDGYSFRNTIGIIKSETDYATMVLSPNAIEISFINTSKCAIHKIVLDTRELTVYRYNIVDDKGEKLPEYPIAFDTSQMFNTTKGIGRRDGIRLYWLHGDNKINVQPIRTSTKDPGRAGALFVDILNIEYIRYDVSGNYKSEPNVRVQAKDFADLCSQANTLKCSTLEIVGQNNGVTFKGMMPNNTMASINRFVSQTEMPRGAIAPINMDEIDNLLGNLRIAEAPATAHLGLSLNVVKTEDLMTVKVPIATVKALSKIHNISPAGTLIRFYFAEGKPTKIESPIGTYGLYTICLRGGRI
ncbi:Hypothetical protein HVR_LOCUS1303 [uncultured virus]|nr:Hypothetical protein HVR_LOCUS1303 [uncultured virus]